MIFGRTFTDHMLTANWTESEGWEPPSIRPLENFSLHPASPALHYAIEVSIYLIIMDASWGDSVSCSILYSACVHTHNPLTGTQM